MTYQRKTRDEWHFLANYGGGWEHELTEDTRAEARQRLREYRENAPYYAYRIVKRRVRLDGARPDGEIRILGPFPPPAGIVGPYARRTESYVYQVFDAAGRKLIGGTSGSDRATCIAHARQLAAEKGILNPAIYGEG